MNIFVPEWVLWFCAGWLVCHIWWHFRIAWYNAKNAQEGGEQNSDADQDQPPSR